MKKLFIFSGRKLMMLQLIALVITGVGLWSTTFSLTNLALAGFFFYLYGAVGMSMMLHRYWSHRSFQFKSKSVELLFKAVGIISTRGSPLAWAHIHREHHRYADTDQDPHRPTTFKPFSFKSTYINKIKVFLIKDFLDPQSKALHEYYLAFILAWILLLALINPQLVYFCWALPVVLNQVSQDLWNYFSHVDVGYRNFDTKDNSRNVIWLWPLVLGEAWHNNHHHSTKKSVKNHWWELDPIESLINLVKA